MFERAETSDHLPSATRTAGSAVFEDAYSGSSAGGAGPSAEAQSRQAAWSGHNKVLVEEGCIPGIEWEDEANEFFAETLTPIMAPESDEAKQWLHDIDGLDDPGILWNGHDGHITQKGVEEFVKQVSQDKDASPEKKEYVEKLEKLLDNWNAEWSSYLQSDDVFLAYGPETLEYAAALTTVNAAMNTCE